MHTISDRVATTYIVERRGHIFYASAGEALVARAVLDVARGSVREVLVWPSWRRRGVASALYAHIEQEIGGPLRPSRIRTAAGKALWKARERRPAFEVAKCDLKAVEASGRALWACRDARRRAPYGAHTA